MAPDNTTKENSSRVAPAQTTRSGLGLYLFLLALQTAGAAIVMMNGLPIYRQMVGDFSKHQPEPGILWWAVAAVALIQVAYWLRVRLQPPLPRGAHIVAGHLAGFVARLSFILASSTFAVMFFVRLDALAAIRARQRSGADAPTGQARARGKDRRARGESVSTSRARKGRLRREPARFIVTTAI